MRKRLFSLFKWLMALIVLVLLPIVLICNWMVTRNAKGKVFDNMEDIPSHKVGLVLGTSPLRANGDVNLYFNYRMEMAAELFHRGKVKRLILSGAHAQNDFDEPQEMKAALIKLGVPEDAMTLDWQGYRTLASVSRMKDEHRCASFIVISQQFHNERAIYLAEHLGMTAIGANAKDVTAYWGLKTRIREYLARVKVFIDLFHSFK